MLSHSVKILVASFGIRFRLFDAMQHIMQHITTALNVLNGLLRLAVWLVKYRLEKEEAQAAKEKHAEPLSEAERGDEQGD